MADVTKNVEIALKIVGANDKTLKSLVTAFENIKKVVDDTTAAVDKFKTKLDSIKVPSGMKNIIAAFKELNGIKFSNLEQVAKGFEKLAAIKTPPDLKPFADEMKKLQNIKVPGLAQFANGVEKLINTPLSALAMKVGTLEKQLTRLKNIGTLPNLGGIANSIEKLLKTPLSGLAMKIGTLETQLGRLAKIGVLPNLGQIGIGLAKIMNTPLSGFNLKITTLEAGLRRLAAINLSQLEHVLKGISNIKLDKVADQLRRTEAAIKATGNTAQRSGLQIGTFMGKVKTVLQFRIISEGFNLLKQSIAGGVTAIMEYDQALKDLQAITGATTLEVAQMGAMILEVASTTKFSASEVAAGMRTIGQAGFSASEAVETMQSVSDLATGTLSNMATTVDLVTTTLRVFQIDASESASVADVFANAVNRSKLTIDKLRTAMNYIGPIARDSGVSFKELAASMGTLANSGLRASTIGTGLRRVFAELIDPSKKLKEAANRAGVALQELDPRTSSLSKVMSNLSLVVDDATVAFDVFGKRGASAVLALSSSGSKFQEMLDVVGTTGTAALQASIQMEGLGVSFKNLQDKVGLLAIAIGDAGIADAMRIVINISRDLIDVLTEIFNNTFVQFVIKAGLVTTAVYGIAKAILFLGKAKAITASIMALTAAFSEVASMALFAGTSVTGLLSTIFPVVAALGALAAAAAFAYSNFNGAEKARDEASKLSDEYVRLSKTLQDYRVNTVSMSKDSDELKDANIALKNQLIETSEEYGELSVAAGLAADSISPLTGEIIDNGDALAEYNKQLDAITFKTIIDAANAANDALIEQTGIVSRLINKWADLITQTKILATQGFWKFLDFSNQALDAENFANKISDGAVSFEELRKAALSYNKTNWTSQQKEIYENYQAINEQANKYIKHLEKTGQIGFDDTIENIEDIARKAEYSGTVLEAMLLKIREIQESNKGDFSNIIEKWQKDVDPQKVAEFVDLYRELGGLFAEGNEDQIGSSQLAKAAFVEELQRIKDRYQAVEDSNGDIVTAYNKFLKEERDLLIKAGVLRTADSKNIARQNIVALLSEKEDLERILKEISATYFNENKETVKLRLKHQEDAVRASLKRQADIIKNTGTTPKDDLNKYKRNLKAREALHARTLLAISTKESTNIITEEEAEKQKLEATQRFYTISLANARAYRNEVDKTKDSEEYEKRNEIALRAEKRFYDQSASYVEDSADLKEDIDQASADKRMTISEALYASSVASNKKATKAIETESKAYYEKGLEDLAAYYDKRNDIVEKDIAKRKNLITNRMKEVEGEYDQLIAATNSVTEKEDLRGEKEKELIELGTKLKVLDDERSISLDKLSASENKEADALQKKQDRLLETIKKAKESSELDDPYISEEETFAIKMEQLERFQAEKYKALVDAQADEMELAQAKADQEKQLANEVANHEKSMQQVRLSRAADFAGNMSSAIKDMYDAGLIKSKEAFIAYKAFAISETIISTYASAVDAFRAMASIPYVGPALGIAAAAAAVAAGLARVAQIRSEEPSYAEGGEIAGHSPHSKADNIKINATAGEYMQPVSAVQKYGKRVMNAIRTLAIPADALKGLISGTSLGLSTPIPSLSLAGGGVVPGQTNTMGASLAVNFDAAIDRLIESKQPVNIMNVYNKQEMLDVLSSPEGLNSIINGISRKKKTVQRILV